MLFVAFFDARAGTEEDRIGRRLEWQIPEGIKHVAEYWFLTSKPGAIQVFEADSYAAMMQITAAWNDLYDITIYPAIEGEEGVKVVKQMMG